MLYYGSNTILVGDMEQTCVNMYFAKQLELHKLLKVNRLTIIVICEKKPKKYCQMMIALA